MKTARPAFLESPASCADEVFITLYREHDDFLRRMGTLWCGERALADDLVQETWLRAWRALPGLRDQGAGRGWLVTILRREIARWHARPLEELSLEQVKEEPAQDSAMEDNAFLHQAMQNLTAQEHALLVACVGVGLSYAQVAERLEISASTVGVRLHRLRQKLAYLLE